MMALLGPWAGTWCLSGASLAESFCPSALPPNLFNQARDLECLRTCPYSHLQPQELLKRQKARKIASDRGQDGQAHIPGILT